MESERGSSSRRRLYLVRHGDVDYFSSEPGPADVRTVGLNAAGRDQVEAARPLAVGGLR